MLAVETEIAEVESHISDTKEDISETERLIAEENKTQEGIEALIGTLTKKKLNLEDEIDFYEKIGEGDPRVLITLTDPVVTAKVDEVTEPSDTEEENEEAIFKYVQNRIEYMTEGNPKKWSYPKSFLQHRFDFWQLPRETIEWKSGDCEDQSILLCTMLRIVGVPASDVRVALGSVQFAGGESGHAWVELYTGGTWYVLDATGSAWNYISLDRYYELFSVDVWGWFNDQDYRMEKSPLAESSVSKYTCI